MFDGFPDDYHMNKEKLPKLPKLPLILTPQEREYQKNVATIKFLTLIHNANLPFVKPIKGTAE